MITAWATITLALSFMFLSSGLIMSLFVALDKDPNKRISQLTLWAISFGILSIALLQALR